MRRLFYSSLMLGAVASLSSYAKAEKTLVSVGGLTVQGGLDIGGAAFYLPSVNFGAGSYAPRSDGQYKRTKSPASGELYGKPILTGRWDWGHGVAVIGTASALGAATLGHGDGQIMSQTSGSPHSIYLEEANIGLTMPVKIAHAPHTLTVLGGRQSFIVDDGFLIGKGTYSAGRRGAWWYAPRFAFSGPGVIKLEGQSVRADAFMLESNTDNDIDRGYDRPKTKFVGFDVSWFTSTPGGHGGSVYAERASYVTLTYFHIRDADTSAGYDHSARADRNGMNVASLSWGGTLFPVKTLGISKNFTFYGSFVSEQNSHAGNGYKSVEAYGMFFEPGYRFTMLPWQPKVFYRYTQFGGGKNPNGTVKRSYDTLFLYDGKRYCYGGYWPGEIIGMYLAPLSNLKVQQFDLTVTAPFHLLKREDGLKLGVHYYNLSLLHPSGAGLHNVANHISDEVDVTAEYAMNATTSAALAGGMAFSGPSGKALAQAGLPAGYPMPKISRQSGILEFYFYKHF